MALQGPGATSLIEWWRLDYAPHTISAWQGLIQAAWVKNTYKGAHTSSCSLMPPRPAPPSTLPKAVPGSPTLFVTHCPPCISTWQQSSGGLAVAWLAGSSSTSNNNNNKRPLTPKSMPPAALVAIGKSLSADGVEVGGWRWLYWLLSWLTSGSAPSPGAGSG